MGNGEPQKGRNRGVSWSSSGFKNSLYLLHGGWIRRCWRQGDQQEAIAIVQEREAWLQLRPWLREERESIERGQGDEDTETW